MGGKVSVTAMSDSNYEDLIAEGYIDGRCVLVVSQERGPGQFEVELVPSSGSDAVRVEYSELIDLLRLATDELRRLQRTPMLPEESQPEGTPPRED